MEAEDTVRLCPPTPGGWRINCDSKCHKAQAEISFKAGWREGYDAGKSFATINMPALVKEGKAEGIREVVEFIHKEFGGYIPDFTGGLTRKNILIDEECGEVGSMVKWQAQKKKWGVTDGSTDSS